MGIEQTRFKFRLIGETSTLEVPVYITTRYSFSQGKRLVMYDAPGRNGSIIFFQGMSSARINLTVRIVRTGAKMLAFGGGLSKSQVLSDEQITMEDLKRTFDEAYENNLKLQVITPLWEDERTYIISDLSWDVAGENAWEASMVLQEYGQTSAKRAKINLVNYQPAIDIAQVLRERNLA